jgi:hypothetical protein
MPKGEPTVVADRGPAITWNGGTLPGVWLTARAIDLAVERCAHSRALRRRHPRSHHIACLAASSRARPITA